MNNTTQISILAWAVHTSQQDLPDIGGASPVRLDRWLGNYPWVPGGGEDCC